jgi:hypothetical protein
MWSQMLWALYWCRWNWQTLFAGNFVAEAIARVTVSTIARVTVSTTAPSQNEGIAFSFISAYSFSFSDSARCSKV